MTALDYRARVMGGDIEDRHAEIRRRFQQLEPALHGIAAEFVITEGDAAQAILRTAQDLSADLIVMGTHGRTGLERILGSVAEKVVRQARCPVLTLKAAPA
jgi:nucleotide-binding universal stress UspA family protein